MISYHIVILLYVEARRRDSSGRHQRHRSDVTGRRHDGRGMTSRRDRQPAGGDADSGGGSKSNDRKTHEDWLNEADYSCILDGGAAVRPPAVINARRTTSWAMYAGRPRLYTTYRCRWGYVASPRRQPAGDGTGSLYCRRGVWVGTAPSCQRFGETTHSPVVCLSHSIRRPSTASASPTLRCRNTTRTLKCSLKLF